MLFSQKSVLAVSILSLGLFLIAPVKANASTIEDQAVSLINTERQRQNLPPLNYSEKLYKASLGHNNVMSDCTKKYEKSTCFSHTVTILNEQTLLNRIKATGYSPQAVAENIAWGYSTSGGIVGAWMGSSGHRANILGNYKEVGCSYMSPYWTCDFGRSAITFGSSEMPTSPKASTSTPTMTQIITPTSISSPTPTTLMQTLVVPTGKQWWCIYVPSISTCQ